MTDEWMNFMWEVFVKGAVFAIVGFLLLVILMFLLYYTGFLS